MLCMLPLSINCILVRPLWFIKRRLNEHHKDYSAYTSKQNEWQLLIFTHVWPHYQEDKSPWYDPCRDLLRNRNRSLSSLGTYDGNELTHPSTPSPVCASGGIRLPAWYKGGDYRGRLNERSSHTSPWQPFGRLDRGADFCSNGNSFGSRPLSINSYHGYSY
jgi:hypothetical protein